MVSWDLAFWLSCMHLADQFGINSRGVLCARNGSTGPSDARGWNLIGSGYKVSRKAPVEFSRAFL